MAKIIVKQTSDEALLVGRKVVYRDTDGKWIAVSELTQKETEALQKFLSDKKLLPV